MTGAQTIGLSDLGSFFGGETEKMLSLFWWVGKALYIGHESGSVFSIELERFWEFSFDRTSSVYVWCLHVGYLDVTRWQ